MSTDGVGEGVPRRSTPIDAVIAEANGSRPTSSPVAAGGAAASTGTPFRGGNWNFIAFCLSATLGVTSIYALSLVLSGKKQADGSSQPIGVIIGFLAYFGLSALVIWRLARAKVLIGEDGLTVVNVVRTHRIPWSQVRSVTIDKRRVKSTYVGRVVVNTDDGDVKATAGTIDWSKHEKKLAPLADACAAHGARWFSE